MRTPLDPRPCRSFPEAVSDRAKRRLEEAEHMLWLDTAHFQVRDNLPGKARKSREETRKPILI